MARETISIRPEKWKSSHEPESVRPSVGAPSPSPSSPLTYARPAAAAAAPALGRKTKDGSQSISAASKIVGRTADGRAMDGRVGGGGGGGDEILSTPRYEAKIPFQWVFHLSLL